MMDLNKIRVHDTMHIRIRKNNPFLSEVLKKGQPIALYYEPSYHEGINNYIRAEYDKICHLLESNGITFIYFPLFLEHFDEYLQYFFPNSIGIDTRSLTVESFYKSIAEDITELPSTGRPMLLISDRKSKADEETAPFSCYDLDYADDNQFGYALRHYLPPHRYRIDDEDDKMIWVHDEGYDADNASNDILFKEIQERIDRLSANGVNRSFIIQILSLKEPLPSKLVIADNFRLLLPDYGNREILLPKLSKALYFFYLRHKEGVLFKKLRDYKDELYDLYRTVSPREDMEAMERSIEDLMDSTKNNINVNCSRIKNAFVSQIDDSIAKLYYIDGRAGEIKRIALDRSLVEDLSGMIM